MTVKSLVCVGVVVLCAGAAGAQELQTAKSPMRTPDVRRFTDPKTGLELRLVQAGLQEVVVEVADKDVSIRKQIRPGQTMTTISVPGDELRLRTDQDGVQVREGDATVAVSIAAPELGRLAEVFDASPAAQAGLRLLTRLDLTPNSFAPGALLLTQALLESPSGVRTAASLGAQWASEHAHGPALVKVALAVKGPGQCWDEYQSSVLDIARDFIECHDSCRWWQVLCPEACSFVWALRAELAMDWLISCSGGLAVR